MVFAWWSQDAADHEAVENRVKPGLLALLLPPVKWQTQMI